MVKKILGEKGFTPSPERASSKQKHKVFNARLVRGFTLIEAVAVLGVLAVTTAILLVNNRLSEQQLSLSKDAARLANTVSRAKSLTLQNLDENSCGYGVHFVPTTDMNQQDSYIFFKDKKSLIDDSCNYVYDEGEAITGQDNEGKLDTGLRFVTTTADMSNSVFIEDVVFYSSDARVKLTRFGDHQNLPLAGIVIIKTEATPASYMTLKITVSGQITSKSGHYGTLYAFDSGNEDLENGTVQKVTEQEEESTIGDENAIICIPESCNGKTCADYDGCGKPCVVCSSGQFCVNKVCQSCACIPDGDGTTCGQCGGNCMSCPVGKTCENSICVSPSVELILGSIYPPLGTK